MQNLLGIFLLTYGLGAISGDSIFISGHEFEIKQSKTRVGPGPNIFSKNNIRSFKSGVKIGTYFNPEFQRWESSELILKKSLGYGNYKFKISANFSELDPNTVIGVFFYDDHSQSELNDMHEIDVIEISKWKNDKCRGQSVQHDFKGMLCSYEFDVTDVKKISCEVDWKPHLLEVKCNNANIGDELIRAKYYRELPHHEVANFRVNLWLFRGDDPSKADELIFEDFSFIPYF